MNRCPITYEECDQKYSKNGLSQLAKGAVQMNDLPYSAAEQLQEAVARAGKMSVQGVQPKLSALFNKKKSIFTIVDRFGHYILKPQNPHYKELPENEDLTMKLASLSGIEVPFHGLVYSSDGSLSYFIKRFDRIGKKKVSVEDFSQLSEMNRELKYRSSMERVAKDIEKFCTFPEIEKIKLFRLTLFFFLTGNEDMHLKNFSLITLKNRVTLSPAYDLLNTTIALKKPQEEFALSLAGKKRNITRELLVNYFAYERLGLNKSVVTKVVAEIEYSYKTQWKDLIAISFLSNEMQKRYISIIDERASRIF